MSSLFIFLLFILGNIYASISKSVTSQQDHNKAAGKVKSETDWFFLLVFFILFFLNNIVYVIQNVSMFLKTHSHDPYSSFSSGLSLHMQ